MDESSGGTYAFGRFRLNAEEGVLRHDGLPIALAPRVFATLLALVRRAGHVVPRETLVSEIWPETFVEDGNLTQNISILRKVLGTDDTGRPYLDTVPKRGYRFAAVVTRVDDGPMPVAAGPSPTPFPVSHRGFWQATHLWTTAIPAAAVIAVLIAAPDSWH